MLRGWLEKGFLIERRVERGEFLPIEVLILSGFGDDFNAGFFCQPLFFVRSVGDQQEIGLFVPKIKTSSGVLPCDRPDLASFPILRLKGPYKFSEAHPFVPEFQPM